MSRRPKKLPGISYYAFRAYARALPASGAGP